MTYDGVSRRILMADLAAAPLADGQIERVKLDVIGTAPHRLTEWACAPTLPP